jgi:hypothetical protein
MALTGRVGFVVASRPPAACQTNYYFPENPLAQQISNRDPSIPSSKKLDAAILVILKSFIFR